MKKRQIALWQTDEGDLKELLQISFSSSSSSSTSSSTSPYRPNTLPIAKRRLPQSAAHTVGLCCAPIATKSQFSL